MRKGIIFGLLVAVMAVPFGVRAVETTPRVKTAAEIEAYTAQMKAQKAGMIEAEKARLRALKAGMVTDYRAKLQQLKDQRKAAVVDNLNTRMCNMNKKLTSVMSAHLDRMSAIVNRIETRANEAKSNGKDISSVETAVAAARTAIASAKEAVATQAAKECTIGLSGGETTVGSEVRNAISGLEAQLKTVREKVATARQAVRKAIVALAHVLGEQVTTTLKEGE